MDREVVEPRVVIAETPERHGIQLALEAAQVLEHLLVQPTLLGQHGIRHSAAVCTEVRGVVTGVIDADIQLRDLLMQAREDPVQVLDRVEDGKRRRIVDVVVHLMAHAIQRHSALLQLPHHLDQAVEAVRIGRAEVVDEQLSARRRELPGGLQRDVHIAGAEDLIERTVTQAIRLARIERLVHDVPDIHRAGEVLYLTHDVVLDTLREQRNVRRIGC